MSAVNSPIANRTFTTLFDRDVTWDDATWILTSSFIIFTMQTGFGLLESGSVSTRNEVNIMVKNAVDVIFGGLSYWMFGFALSFGDKDGSNPYFGWGYFFVDISSNEPEMGILFSTYVFQLSFATTATTIVSGAMAERTKLTSYIIFSFLNTIVYCLPAHWEWASNGFLYEMGCVDIAGSGAVHLLGGVSALVAAIILKPRIGRFPEGRHPSDNPLPMGNPANTLVGMFMLWWGWLAFNCGSTFGISGGKWKLAAKAAVCTLNGSMGGGAMGIIFSYFLNKGKFDIGYMANSILGALVAITAPCAIVSPWEAIIIGMIGGIVALLSFHAIERIHVDDPVGAIAVHGVAGIWVSIIGMIGGIVALLSFHAIERFHVNDPVGAIAVHGVAGIWGMLAVGLFADLDPLEDTTRGLAGVFHGGGFYFLGVQALACVAVATWSAVSTAVILLAIHFTLGIRLSAMEEKRGADYVEHGYGDGELPEEFKHLEGFSTGSIPEEAQSSRSVHSSTASLRSLESMEYGSEIDLVRTTSAGRSRSRQKVVPISVIPSPDESTIDTRNRKMDW